MTDPLTSETLRALREKAEKATPGPWSSGGKQYVVSLGDRPRCVVNAPSGGGCYVGTKDKPQAIADAYFIAACDPQTVLRLVDELERLGAEVARRWAELKRIDPEHMESSRGECE